MQLAAEGLTRTLRSRQTCHLSAARIPHHTCIYICILYKLGIHLMNDASMKCCFSLRCCRVSVAYRYNIRQILLGLVLNESSQTGPSAVKRAH